MIRIPHPFFDPSSLYNRLRATSDSRERTIGWFLWLKKRREKNLESLGECRVVGIDISSGAPCKMEIKTTLWSAKENLLYCNVETNLLYDALCRVLIIDKDVLKRLVNTTGTEAVTDEDILSLFDSAAQDAEKGFEISRVLSAVPELNGEITKDKGFGVLGVNLGSAEPLLPFPIGTILVAVIAKKE